MCYGGMQNDPEFLHHFMNRVEVYQSLTTIAVLKQQDVVQAKVAFAKDLQKMPPSAGKKMLQKNNDVSKLNKKNYFFVT
jgi:hypothetical protein